MVKKKINFVVLTTVVCALLFTACSAKVTPAKTVQQRDTVYQLSTIGSLIAGNYDGFQTAEVLKQHGDFGIGTFDALDGELVMIDGTIYKIKDTGKAELVPDSITMPFAAVTFFDKDYSLEIKDIKDYKTLSAKLDKSIINKNNFYAFRIDGTFAFLKLRSVPKQEKPYPILSKVTENQPTFEHTNIKGSLIGYWCPDYIGSINVPGYHFHFISEDRTIGGHLLEVSFTQAQAFADTCDSFNMQLPLENTNAGDMDMSAEINKVEK